MNILSLKLWEDIERLTEIFQSLDIKFAFVNDKYEQIHQPCKCRDFLGDLMWSRVHKKPVSIYGMKYDYAKNPYDLETTRLSLKFPSIAKKNNFIKNFGYLTEREKAYNIPLSILLETDQDNTLIIEGNKEWQTAVWKLSLYTFYMKVMAYDNVENLDSPECDYKEKLTDELESKFLSNILSPINPIEENLDNNHNFSGFVSCATVFNKYQSFKELGDSYLVPKMVAKEVLGAI